jgi:hypothetical protein
MEKARDMTRPIILPYDGSPVARASLRRVGGAVREGGIRSGNASVIVATAGVDPSEIDRLTAEARSIAGDGVPVQVRLLRAGDPIGGLHELAASLPDAVLAAPVKPKGRAAWYAEACRLGGLPHTLMLLFIRPNELKAFEAASPERKRPLHRVSSLLHAGVRLF